MHLSASTICLGKQSFAVGWKGQKWPRPQMQSHSIAGFLEPTPVRMSNSYLYLYLKKMSWCTDKKKLTVMKRWYFCFSSWPQKRHRPSQNFWEEVHFCHKPNFWEEVDFFPQTLNTMLCSDLSGELCKIGCGYEDTRAKFYRYTKTNELEQLCDE